MLVGNVTANLIGAVVITNLVSPLELSAVSGSQFAVVQAISTPVLFLLGVIVFLLYERPIRRYIDHRFAAADNTIPAPQSALRRLLNEPFFAVALDMGIWLLAAVFWSTYFWHMGEPDYVIRRSFLINLNIGLITSVVAFFLLEHIFQKTMAPVFFPHGRIYDIPGTIRISIRVRLAAMLLACNLVPFLATIQVYFNLSSLDDHPGVILDHIGKALMTNSLLFMVTGIWIWVLVSANLSRPFASIIRTLTRVREGRFDDRVQVTSNDEIGYTGDVVNQMAEGLQERERMRLSMMLAREVQQNLLPAGEPRAAGLDIAGTSIYCDETGGDYYDYIRYETGVGEGMPLAVMVGDVAGHGVSSALLMATARALLRQRLSLPGDLAAVFSDVNCQLSQDVGASGQFMTLMGLAVNPAAGSVAWVRAGHDPAMLFEPREGRFAMLSGPGIAMGVDGTYRYSLQRRDQLVEGSIILVGTDGLWESCNTSGVMFGKARVQDILRRHARQSADVIRDRLVAALQDFSGDKNLEDDVTLVVLKLDRHRTGRSEEVAGTVCRLTTEPRGTGSGLA
jgi:sigma-B regulation protein RsbU (phosphoserine phosphatase)